MFYFHFLDLVSLTPSRIYTDDTWEIVLHGYTQEIMVYVIEYIMNHPSNN